MKYFFSLVLGFGLISGVYSQSIVGKWKTIDDETGKTRSIVEITEQNGKIYGNIVKLFKDPSEDQDPICDKCPGDRKDKKIIGMEIISGLEKEGDKWELDDGILDPEKGKLYDCKIWLKSENELAVRGYIGFFYRTQSWFRAE
jgi:uncharacterized protein (DUF2147 family)